MGQQNDTSDVIILPHSEVMPADEAQKKARALAEIQEQLLTMSRSLPEKLHEKKYLPDNPQMRDLNAGSFFFSRSEHLIHFQLIFGSFCSSPRKGKIASKNFSSCLSCSTKKCDKTQFPSIPLA